LRIETERMVLRPLSASDVDAVATGIFGDPEVVATLAHDGSTPERALEHARRWFELAGEGSAAWHESGIGLFALLDRTGHSDGGRLVGVAGARLDVDGVRREFFYALTGAARGRGLMQEAVRAILAAHDRLGVAGPLYAIYWPILNPASERILLSHGFEPRGRLPFLDDYPAERFHEVRQFDLWRLGRATPETLGPVLERVSLRLGMLSVEDGPPPEAVTSEITAALPSHADAGSLAPIIGREIERGRTNPGMTLVVRPSRAAC
jgi:RimJ/RimL family protein N-acetyltransferase